MIGTSLCQKGTVSMKKMCIHKHIITFMDDGQTPEAVSDRTLVERLSESPDATEEVKALARMVLALSNQTSENDNAAIN